MSYPHCFGVVPFVSITQDSVSERQNATPLSTPEQLLSQDMEVDEDGDHEMLDRVDGCEEREIDDDNYSSASTVEDTEDAVAPSSTTEDNADNEPDEIEYRKQHEQIYYDDSMHHFNWLGHGITGRTSTPPAVSLVVILTSPPAWAGGLEANLKNFVLLREAMLTVDPVIYRGDISVLQRLTGEELRNGVTGSVAVYYTPFGRWVDDSYQEDEDRPEEDGLETSQYPEDAVIFNGWLRHKGAGVREDFWFNAEQASLELECSRRKSLKDRKQSPVGKSRLACVVSSEDLSEPEAAVHPSLLQDVFDEAFGHVENWSDEVGEEEPASTDNEYASQQEVDNAASHPSLLQDVFDKAFGQIENWSDEVGEEEPVFTDNDHALHGDFDMADLIASLSDESGEDVVAVGEVLDEEYDPFKSVQNFDDSLALQPPSSALADISDSSEASGFQDEGQEAKSMLPPLPDIVTALGLSTSRWSDDINDDEPLSLGATLESGQVMDEALVPAPLHVSKRSTNFHLHESTTSRLTFKPIDESALDEVLEKHRCSTNEPSSPLTSPIRTLYEAIGDFGSFLGVATAQERSDAEADEEDAEIYGEEPDSPEAAEGFSAISLRDLDIAFHGTRAITAEEESIDMSVEEEDPTFYDEDEMAVKKEEFRQSPFTVKNPMEKALRQWSEEKPKKSTRGEHAEWPSSPIERGVDAREEGPSADLSEVTPAAEVLAKLRAAKSPPTSTGGVLKRSPSSVDNLRARLAGGDFGKKFPPLNLVPAWMSSMLSERGLGYLSTISEDQEASFHSDDKTDVLVGMEQYLGSSDGSASDFAHPNSSTESSGFATISTSCTYPSEEIADTKEAAVVVKPRPASLKRSAFMPDLASFAEEEDDDSSPSGTFTPPRQSPYKRPVSNTPNAMRRKQLRFDMPTIDSDSDDDCSFNDASSSWTGLGVVFEDDHEGSDIEQEEDTNFEEEPEVATLGVPGTATVEIARPQSPTTNTSFEAATFDLEDLYFDMTPLPELSLTLPSQSPSHHPSTTTNVLGLQKTRDVFNKPTTTPTPAPRKSSWSTVTNKLHKRNASDSTTNSSSSRWTKKSSSSSSRILPWSKVENKLRKRTPPAAVDSEQNIQETTTVKEEKAGFGNWWRGLWSRR